MHCEAVESSRSLISLSLFLSYSIYLGTARFASFSCTRGHVKWKHVVIVHMHTKYIHQRYRRRDPIMSGASLVNPISFLVSLSHLGSGDSAESWRKSGRTNSNWKHTSSVYGASCLSWVWVCLEFFPRESEDQALCVLAIRAWSTFSVEKTISLMIILSIRSQIIIVELRCFQQQCTHKSLHPN